MGRSVRISEEAARAALSWMGQSRVPVAVRASEELRAELLRLELPPSLADYDRLKTPEKDRPPRMRRPPKVVTRSRKPSKEEKRDETSAIREACLKRAAGRCECGCGCAFSTVDVSIAFPEMDHFFGRGKVKQSVETCWILRADCHREKTNNRPDAATWFRKFIEHCARHGIAYDGARHQAVKRLRFVETRAALPAAPRTRP